jgi:hypothetical protein
MLLDRLRRPWDGTLQLVTWSNERLRAREAAMKLLVASLCLAVFGAASVAAWIKFHPRECSGCQATEQFKPTLLKSTRKEVGGNPQNVVDHMKRVYLAMVGYRSIHGHLPSPQELKDTSRDIIPGLRLSKTDFENEDQKDPNFAAHLPGGRGGFCFNYISKKRPDGSGRPDSPAPGERDVWLRCLDYQRSRWVKEKGGDNQEWYGVVIGLFSDGKIEILPADQMVFVQLQANAFEPHFPDETGLPKKVIPAKDVWHEYLRQEGRYPRK